MDVQDFSSWAECAQSRGKKNVRLEEVKMKRTAKRF